MANHLSSEQREDVHFRVLQLLVENPEYSQRQIAGVLGISLGRANYCLKALIEKGHVKVENFKASSHKLGYMHVLTPQGIAERTAIATRFLQRKLAEYEALTAEIGALQREHAEVAASVGLGFGPGFGPGPVRGASAQPEKPACVIGSLAAPGAPDAPAASAIRGKL